MSKTNSSPVLILIATEDTQGIIPWALKLVHIYLYFSDSEALKNAHISKQMKIPEHVFSKAIRLDTRKSIPNGGGVPYSVQCR